MNTIIKPKHFQNLFWKVQENLLSIISNKSLIGMSSYKNRLILSRIQEQLNFMVNKSWKYAPDLFSQIYRYIYIEINNKFYII